VRLLHVLPCKRVYLINCRAVRFNAFQHFKDEITELRIEVWLSSLNIDLRSSRYLFRLRVWCFKVFKLIKRALNSLLLILPDDFQSNFLQIFNRIDLKLHHRYPLYSLAPHVFKFCLYLFRLDFANRRLMFRFWRWFFRGDCFWFQWLILAALKRFWWRFLLVWGNEKDL